MPAGTGQDIGPTGSTAAHTLTGQTKQSRTRPLLGVLAIVLAGCGMTDDKMILEDLTPASAGTAKIDAQFKTARVPAAFTPIKAIKGHTTWGSTYLTYSVGYSASPRDAQAFLDEAHARKDTDAYRSTDSCAPNAPGGPELAAPTESVKLWIDNGVLDRCATIEPWYIPTSELKSDKAAATAYRVPTPPNADNDHPTKIVIGVSFPTSSQP
jgi:hypothetical protein